MCSSILFAQWGVVKIPVIDAILEPAQSLCKCSSDIEQFYNKLPLTVEAGGFPRAHQLLFNEVVSVLDKKEQELLVSVNNIIFAQSDITKSSQNSFWVLRKNIALDSECKKANISDDDFPIPLSCQAQNKKYSWTQNKSPSPEHIVLTLPWCCTKNNQTYSAGTRFVRNLNNDTSNSYGINLVHWQTQKQCTTLVPRNRSRIESLCSKQNAQNQLVELLKLWLTELNGSIIPYVWGGSSFVHYYTDVTPFQKYISGVCEYQRPETYRPHTGFDCSEMILRAAQICGIPYPYKTSSLIQQHLEVVQPNEKISEGDIIWYEGHVMVISDIAHNKMIEARGYTNGYGKMHEVSLSTIFHDITNYDQLLAWSHKKKPLAVYNADGCLHRTVTNYKILKLRSAWS